MKTLYLDLGMGAAGDMLAAALLELLPDPGGFVEELNAMGIPGVRFEREISVKSGITGTHMKVVVDGIEEESEDVHVHGTSGNEGHEHMGNQSHGEGHGTGGHNEHADGPEHVHTHSHSHSHSSMSGIKHIVNDHLDIPEEVKEDVLKVFDILADAESRVHGVPVSDIHFHEVGSMDAVADITAVCLLINKLRPDKIAASPVHTGYGHVRCAHGVLPVPAPATALILEGIPAYSGNVEGELCTPTGAALIKHFVGDFGGMPVMKLKKTGYGMGKKDFSMLNCVRAILGESGEEGDTISELRVNVDDMTAEEISFAAERIFAEGALDVYTIPIYMKKQRPGTLMAVMCREKDRERIAGAMFKYTSSIGIRETVMRRYVLKRRIEETDTPYGRIRKKVSSGYGVEKIKYEYDDISSIAKKNGMALGEVLDGIKKK